jgi:4-coumarate--CoA ligase
MTSGVGAHPNISRNAETFVDGWVRTGDEGSVDENNWVYVHDRLKVRA